MKVRNYFDVAHYLGIYQIRLRMLEEGVTKPTPEGEIIIRTIVEKLSKMPLDEKIILSDKKMFDSKGNLIVDFNIMS
ncbi:hypothetical protein V3Q90_02225 [Flavobacterium oreochromis]|uniref:Uncharacterized protein n=1 Tax=Flavobacterium oreochromis TaxID=2906078 RepID=A0ABW8P5A2_9FLAO|nr:hypothetical protein [Flavobacterium oreochromis]OWP75062.1 hypothetical protein BWG23_12070 [Flavobacterium oreochromis]